MDMYVTMYEKECWNRSDNMKDEIGKANQQLNIGGCTTSQPRTPV